MPWWHVVYSLEQTSIRLTSKKETAACGCLVGANINNLSCLEGAVVAMTGTSPSLALRDVSSKLVRSHRYIMLLHKLYWQAVALKAESTPCQIV